MNSTTIFRSRTSFASVSAGLLLLAFSVGCVTQPPKPSVKKIPAGQEHSGFLKDYANLKPTPGLEGEALGYASTDVQKNLHKYIACVIDPVEVYLATNADDAKVGPAGRSAVAEYFRAALVKAVSSAYPVVEQPGPLVLRLRAAVVGVDSGGDVTAADQEAASKESALTHRLNIGKVRVEMELVDSESGEQIAALVDKENLGADAEITSAMSRSEKWTAARVAFDGWASRVRTFLDAAHELPAADVERAKQASVPY